VQEDQTHKPVMTHLKTWHTEHW